MVDVVLEAGAVTKLRKVSMMVSASGREYNTVLCSNVQVDLKKPMSISFGGWFEVVC